MSERGADYCRPDRLKTEACIALVAEGREFSADFRESLSSHDTMPTLFGIRDLATYAQSGLEVQVVQNFQRSLVGLLQRHRSEWDSFKCCLPAGSWVHEIAEQL